MVHNQEGGRHFFLNTDKYKTSILEVGRHKYSQAAFLFLFFFFLVGSFIGSGAGFSFHYVQQSNINLVFSVSPQADMDSLEGNDTPKSSHEPFHPSHKLHTHHQL